MELNERITQLRKQAGMTQEQLGEQLGVSRQAVSKWEAGQATPDVAYIAQMCRLFGVSSDWLLLGESGSQSKLARCVRCGTVLAEKADYCHKCGANQDRKESYCLYLHDHNEFSYGLAQGLAALFSRPWAAPAFPCDGDPADPDVVWRCLHMAPMVLCAGLTQEQAQEGLMAMGTDAAELVRVYREQDLEECGDGQVIPTTPPEAVTVPRPVKEPLSGIAIFGLVVLGVIAALFIMSIF